MGTRCERIVGLAFNGFCQRTSGIMGEVVELDAQIDRDEVEIHALILRILALRQPVADDLRFLATALRLITDLERIGDEAVNIAERAFEDDGAAQLLVVDELTTMAGARSECCIRRSMHSYVGMTIRRIACLGRTTT